MITRGDVEKPTKEKIGKAVDGCIWKKDARKGYICKVTGQLCGETIEKGLCDTMTKLCGTQYRTML